MPMKLNVGLSRKIGEANYGSRGAVVNIEMEVDSALVSEPQKLQERIRQLFGLVRSSLTDELNGGHADTASKSGPDAQPHSGQNGNGASRTTGQRSNGPRPATQSQAKAIYAIARSQRIDVASYLLERFRVRRPEDLSIKEASQLIDELKAQSGTGG